MFNNCSGGNIEVAFINKIDGPNVALLLELTDNLIIPMPSDGMLKSEMLLLLVCAKVGIIFLSGIFADTLTNGSYPPVEFNLRTIFFVSTCVNSTELGIV